jgi:hypothetical protein
MATHEIYVGGPPTANYSRAMFPAPAFNAAAQWALDLKPSAHKGPVDYQLGRVLKPGTTGSTRNANDYALQEFIRNTNIVQGDVLGSILVPPNCLFHGVYVFNRKAVGQAMVITPSLRGVTGGTFPTIDANALLTGFTRAGGTAWQTASGTLSDAADGTPFLIVAPTVLDLTLTTLTAKSDLYNLDLTLVPVVTAFDTGQY